MFGNVNPHVANKYLEHQRCIIQKLIKRVQVLAVMNANPAQKILKIQRELIGKVWQI